ncbi:MAG: energy transducer TonB [Ignavibacteriales bacterium]|nr:energy transducer TonB [Ignavibacteriales bacterium]
MTKITYTLLILFFAFQISVGQDIIEKKFYKDKWGGPSIDEKKAKVVEYTIKEKDGTLRYEMRSISNNKLLRLRSYKDGSPVGKWISSNGKELDYDFQLQYIDKESDNLDCYILQGENGDKFKNIDLPVFPNENNDFRYFVQKQLIYPEICVENGIQGRILFQFLIDEKGKLTNISVIEGVDKILDKEAARAIHLSPDWIPAKMDGEPISLCVKMKVIFQLQ